MGRVLACNSEHRGHGLVSETPTFHPHGRVTMLYPDTRADEPLSRAIHRPLRVMVATLDAPPGAAVQR